MKDVAVQYEENDNHCVHDLVCSVQFGLVYGDNCNILVQMAAMRHLSWLLSICCFPSAI